MKTCQSASLGISVLRHISYPEYSACTPANCTIWPIAYLQKLLLWLGGLAFLDVAGLTEWSILFTRYQEWA